MKRFIVSKSGHLPLLERWLVNTRYNCSGCGRSDANRNALYDLIWDDEPDRYRSRNSDKVGLVVVVNPTLLNEVGKLVEKWYGGIHRKRKAYSAPTTTGGTHD